tara:strand:+ start:207 stop:452 length:246 start_codon:yes stop_codon:yes gene_type:complete
MTNLSRLIYFCNEQKRVDNEDAHGSDGQIWIHIEVYNEAQRIALKEGREGELEDFCRKTEKATYAEQAEGLLEFFNAREQS